MPSARTGRPIATYDVTAIGKGMASFGQAISQAGATLAAHQSASDKYDAETRFQEFKWNQMQTLDQSKNDTTPDQINGFTDRWVKGYQENANQFLGTVPDSLKQEYGLKLKSTERQGFGEASRFMRGEQRRSAIDRLGKMKSLYLQRSQTGAPIDDIKNDYETWVKTNHYLSEIEKEAVVRKDLGDIEIAHAQSRWKSSTDLDAVMRDLGGVLLDTDENPELRAQPKFSSTANDNRPITAFSKPVNKAITEAAQGADVSPQLMAVFARIESSGNPNARTGSYKGLFQLSDSEFKKYGGGDIYDVNDNATAAANKLKAETAAFENKYGRAPSPTDLYMVHQQGEAGYAAHMKNPDLPAWENMFSTGEGRNKGERWAKAAIWGNIPSDVKKQFPDGVESVTSADFVKIWENKVARFGGKGASTQPNILSASYKGPYSNIPAEARMKLLQTFQSEYNNRKRAISILKGELPVDPADKNDRETIDNAAKVMIPIEKIQARDWQTADNLSRLADKISYIPRDAFSTLRGMAINGTPEDRTYAYQIFGRLMRERPGALKISGGDGFNKELVDEIETYNTMVLHIGIPEDQAIARIDEMRTSDFKAMQQSRKKDAEEVVKELTVDDITKEYKDWFGYRRPAAGGSDRRASFMLDAYRDAVRYHYTRTGDPELAKQVAINELTKHYKVSSITGNRRLMRNRPEDYYPLIQTSPDEEPSHKYFQDELKRAVNEAAGKLRRVDTDVNPELRSSIGKKEDFVELGEQISLEDIYIEANDQTNADLTAGIPYPSYSVVWVQKDENGIPALVASPIPFYVDVKAAQAKQLEMQHSELKARRASVIRVNKAVEEFKKQYPEIAGKSITEDDDLQRQIKEYQDAGGTSAVLTDLSKRAKEYLLERANKGYQNLMDPERAKWSGGE